MARVTITNNQTSQYFVPSPIADFVRAGQSATFDGISTDEMEQSAAFVAAVEAGTISVLMSEDPLVPDTLEANVGAAQLQMFASADVAADGTAQSTAHGLGVVPSVVMVIPTDGHDGVGGSGTQFPTITEGTHTTTSVVVTVTNGASYRILAFA
tara:strand:- start:275898 stop:276359 length:462 start_codon:yes stop_codon:yes gene_type:complete